MISLYLKRLARHKNFHPELLYKHVLIISVSFLSFFFYNRFNSWNLRTLMTCKRCNPDIQPVTFTFRNQRLVKRSIVKSYCRPSRCKYTLLKHFKGAPNSFPKTTTRHPYVQCHLLSLDKDTEFPVSLPF